MACSMQLEKYTTLMIIGKTGNGKSACGNTILGERTFTSNASATSVTKLIGQGVALFGNRVIKVIDTPGFEDTQYDEEEGLKLVSSECEKVLMLCPYGINACLIVLRYGSRFTKEEKETIKHIKQIFGETFLEKFCILVMTYGDNFFHDHQKNLTFEQWVKNQTGDFKRLYEECGEKIILFDNKNTSRDNQIQELLNIVDNVDEIYTDKHFEEARKTREKMLVTAKLPVIRDRTFSEISLIYQELNKVFQLQRVDVSVVELDRLKVRAEVLLSENIELDNDTGVLKELINQVKSLVDNINAEIKFKDEMQKQINTLQNNKSNHDAFLLQNKTDAFLLQNKADKERLFNEIERLHSEIMLVNNQLTKKKLHPKCIVM